MDHKEISTQVVRAWAQGIMALSPTPKPGRLQVSEEDEEREVFQNHLINVRLPDIYAVIEELAYVGRIREDNDEVRTMGSTTNGAMPPPPAPPQWPSEDPPLWLSPTEQALVDACTNECQKATVICEKAGYPYSSTIRQMLSNLVDRKIIAKCPDGYMLRCRQ